MMYINGEKIETIEQLEIAIADFSENQKLIFRNEFNGIPNIPPEPTQFEKDRARYLKRSDAKSIILADMAAENMTRVRNGIWTVPQLISLTQDAQLKDILDDINTLSFEIAATKIPGLTNPLITSDIKSGWVTKLQGHFYL